MKCIGPGHEQCIECVEGMVAVNGTCHECHSIDRLFMNEDFECEEVCGDGIFLGVNSECDDHNTESGDGCSSTCKIEFGYSCGTDGTTCKEIIPPQLTLGLVEKPNVLFL